MDRLEAIVARLPEAERVDIEEWGDQAATHLTVKLSKDEAAAVVATEPSAEPAGYGLGRHGWVSVTLAETGDRERWAQVGEWVRTSYTLVAPKRLARLVE